MNTKTLLTLGAVGLGVYLLFKKKKGAVDGLGGVSKTTMYFNVLKGYIKKIGSDSNGNKSIYIFLNGKNRKIQTNGNLPNTHRLNKNEILENIEIIEKEITAYLEKTNTIK